MSTFARLATQMPHAGILLVSARRFPRSRPGLARLEIALHEVLTDKELPPTDRVAWPA
ncbi:hypothetical protein [Micromonospora sp. SH-82]|uniref:hypothetical protein n=1 Tax=Micromonospora sp. SH-82 TaxID=3132938 RepID=UPI003EB6FB05